MSGNDDISPVRAKVTFPHETSSQSRIVAFSLWKNRLNINHNGDTIHALSPCRCVPYVKESHIVNTAELFSEFFFFPVGMCVCTHMCVCGLHLF